MEKNLNIEDMTIPVEKLVMNDTEEQNESNPNFGSIILGLILNAIGFVLTIALVALVFGGPAVFTTAHYASKNSLNRASDATIDYLRKNVITLPLPKSGGEMNNGIIADIKNCDTSNPELKSPFGLYSKVGFLNNPLHQVSVQEITFGGFKSRDVFGFQGCKSLFAIETRQRPVVPINGDIIASFKAPKLNTEIENIERLNTAN